MVRAEEKVAKIMKNCGFIRNFLLEMDINEDIRQLEEFARAHRPPTARPTEPLIKFLPPGQAKKLEELRKERLRIKKEIDRSIVCSKERISTEGIVLIKTKKGIFAEKPPFTPEIKEKARKKEEKEGLATLFG